MDSRYEEPDGGVDCAADHGSVPLGFGTALSGPRLGPRLWLDRKASPACDGHSRQTHCTSLAVAERFCRTIDWVHSPRVPGPHDRPRRGSPAPVSDLLRKLLKRNQNASRASERRAEPPPNRADWYPEITSGSRRTPSPIRPNVVFGTHRFTESGDPALVLDRPAKNRYPCRKRRRPNLLSHDLQRHRLESVSQPHCRRRFPRQWADHPIRCGFGAADYEHVDRSKRVALHLWTRRRRHTGR